MVRTPTLQKPISKAKSDRFGTKFSAALCLLPVSACRLCPWGYADSVVPRLQMGASSAAVVATSCQQRWRVRYSVSLVLHGAAAWCSGLSGTIYVLQEPEQASGPPPQPHVQKGQTEGSQQSPPPAVPPQEPAGKKQKTLTAFGVTQTFVRRRGGAVYAVKEPPAVKKAALLACPYVGCTQTFSQPPALAAHNDKHIRRGILWCTRRRLLPSH